MEQSNRNPLIECNIMDTLSNVEDQLKFFGELILHFQSSGLEFDSEAGPGLSMSIRSAHEALRCEIDKDKGEGIVFAASSKLNEELRERETRADAGDLEGAGLIDPTAIPAASKESDGPINAPPMNTLIQDAPGDSLSRISDAVSAIMEQLSSSGKLECERGNTQQHKVFVGMHLFVGTIKDAVDYEAKRLGSVRV